MKMLDVLWDNKAKVWVATDDCIPGLVTEAETLEELDKKLQIMIPEIIEANNA